MDLSGSSLLEGTAVDPIAYCFLEDLGGLHACRPEAAMSTRKIAAAALTIAALASVGCRVENNKHGDNDNVKIATPFGGMTVKTNDASVEESLGLPIYPGAELVKKKGKDDGAADVNLSFGKFQLRVKAASYKTTDGPDEVGAFYRKALRRYGDIIQCENGNPVGSPTHTAEGLTCDNNNHSHTDEPHGGKLEFKAGSKQHQHIVAIDSEDGGTRIGIVALDLPGPISTDGGDEQTQ
jgi:hypothetical protein